MNMFVYQRPKSIKNETEPIYKLHSFNIFNLHHITNSKNMQKCIYLVLICMQFNYFRFNNKNYYSKWKSWGVKILSYFIKCLAPLCHPLKRQGRAEITLQCSLKMTLPQCQPGEKIYKPQQYMCYCVRRCCQPDCRLLERTF